MPTSFIKSTINFFQSSFSEFFDAICVRTASTSTLCGAAAALATGGGAVIVAVPLPEDIAGIEEPALEVPLAGAALPGVEVVAGCALPPKILDIRVFYSFMYS